MNHMTDILARLSESASIQYHNRDKLYDMCKDGTLLLARGQWLNPFILSVTQQEYDFAWAIEHNGDKPNTQYCQEFLKQLAATCEDNNFVLKHVDNEPNTQNFIIASLDKTEDKLVPIASLTYFVELRPVAISGFAFEMAEEYEFSAQVND